MFRLKIIIAQADWNCWNVLKAEWEARRQFFGYQDMKLFFILKIKDDLKIFRKKKIKKIKIKNKKLMLAMMWRTVGARQQEGSTSKEAVAVNLVNGGKDAEVRHRRWRSRPCSYFRSGTLWLYSSPSHSLCYPGRIPWLPVDYSLVSWINCHTVVDSPREGPGCWSTLCYRGQRCDTTAQGSETQEHMELYDHCVLSHRWRRGPYFPPP